jgi:hypothetical protein
LDFHWLDKIGFLFFRHIWVFVGWHNWIFIDQALSLIFIDQALSLMHGAVIPL